MGGQGRLAADSSEVRGYYPPDPPVLRSRAGRSWRWRALGPGRPARLRAAGSLELGARHRTGHGSLARAAGRVVALELAPEMIRGRAAEARRLSPTSRLVAADMRESPLRARLRPGAAIDDPVRPSDRGRRPPARVSTAARHLVPGGRSPPSTRPGSPRSAARAGRSRRPWSRRIRGVRASRSRETGGAIPRARQCTAPLSTSSQGRRVQEASFPASPVVARGSSGATRLAPRGLEIAYPVGRHIDQPSPGIARLRAPHRRRCGAADQGGPS